jgi:hypothetical protein
MLLSGNLQQVTSHSQSPTQSKSSLVRLCATSSPSRLVGSSPVVAKFPDRLSLGIDHLLDVVDECDESVDNIQSDHEQDVEDEDEEVTRGESRSILDHKHPGTDVAL